MSDELYIGTGPTTGGAEVIFAIGEKPSGSAVEVCIGDFPTLDAQEVKALLLHIAGKVAADGLPAIRKQARQVGRR